MTPFLSVPDNSHYWLLNGRVPLSLLSHSALSLIDHSPQSLDREALVSINIEINDGKVVSLQTIGCDIQGDALTVDMRCGLIWPCFVDMHTHLDKGHIWPRSPNPDGTFSGALVTVQQDSVGRWDAEDVYRRMEFGLKCSYAHGTQAIRTHLDAFDEQGEISFEVFRQMREKWANKIVLQAVCLVSLDYFMGPKGEKLADLVADSGGILGGVSLMNPDIIQQIEQMFKLAKERELDLDFHADESLDPNDMTLRHIAEAAIRHEFTGEITCGHCCSLSVQSENEVRKTVDLVKAAGISVVSLPMCNLYLQDRKTGRTPRYRGVTALHELKAAGVKVAIASDNCRDPFFAYGDHDGLEVFTQSARIGHLDHPIGNWPQSVNRVPAEMMGLENVGQIGVGLAADLVVFKARSFNELMSRGQGDRVIIRQGKQIDSTLPDYAELDDLMAI
jgi:cytosine/creatinine deaminase